MNSLSIILRGSQRIGEIIYLCGIAYHGHHPEDGLEKIDARNVADGACCPNAECCNFQNALVSRCGGECGWFLGDLKL
jgi:hypothetical protein